MHILYVDNQNDTACTDQHSQGTKMLADELQSLKVSGKYMYEHESYEAFKFKNWVKFLATFHKSGHIPYSGKFSKGSIFK